VLNYIYVAAMNTGALLPGQWNSIAGSFMLSPTDAATGNVLLLYFEGPPAGTAIMLDDVSITLVSTTTTTTTSTTTTTMSAASTTSTTTSSTTATTAFNASIAFLANADFETGSAAPWDPYFAPRALAVGPAYARSGHFGVLASGRTASWQGPSQVSFVLS
jgi:hypothetical protein